MEDDSKRVEAERLLGIAANFLESRDLPSTRDFAVLAQETAPLLDGSDFILAIADVLLAAEKRINNRPNYYAILQLENRSDDLDLLKKQYRRLALLLHPDKNKYSFSHDAFKLVADAWAVVSDPAKKSVFDNEFSVYERVDLRKQKQFQSPAATRRMPAQGRIASFWTACPYCYNLYEYPRVYQDCCLKCGNCDRAMHAAEIPTVPPVVQGKEEYYCCWGFFPMGFMTKSDGGSGQGKSGFPNWMPPMFGNGNEGVEGENYADADVTNRARNVTPVHKSAPVPGAKKRGRPRKNV